MTQRTNQAQAPPADDTWSEGAGLHVHVATEALTWPVPTSDHISSRQGQRWARTHRGIDISAAVGEPVVSIGAGTVVHSGEFGQGGTGFGRGVVIRHDALGIDSLYAHMDDTYLQPGDKVKGGEEIGTVGMTGRVTGPHLHLEVHRDGRALNPATFFGR